MNSMSKGNGDLVDNIDLILDAIKEVRADVGGVHDRLDTLNGRTRTVEQKVAVHTWAFSIIGAVLLVGVPIILKLFSEK